jgi:serine/threonine protein kinase
MLVFIFVSFHSIRWGEKGGEGTMQEENFRCPGCMEELIDLYETCPLCGFSRTEYEKEKDQRGLLAGTRLKHRYEVGKILGVGGFSIIYLAWDQEEEEKVAIKEYFPGEISYQEGTNLEKLGRKKGIITVRDFFEENQTAYLVMDYLSGINLKEYIEEGHMFQEEELLAKIKPVLFSLKSIHEQGIIHRDISPDNLILDDKGDLTLIDFGAARWIEEERERSTTLLMKYGYAPEEQYRSRGKLGPWSDIYALSATMYYLLTRVRPSQSIDRLVGDDMLPLSRMGISVSENTSRVIEKGMEVKAENRYQDLGAFLDDLFGGIQNKKQSDTDREKKNGTNQTGEKEKHRFLLEQKLEKWILFLSLVVGVLLISFVILTVTGKIRLKALLSFQNGTETTLSSEEETVKINGGSLFILLRASTSDYSAIEESYLTQAAKESGFTRVTIRDYKEDEVSQNQLIREAIDDDYDAIVCDPGYRTFSTDLFSQALEQGIPVLLVNHGTSNLEDITLSVSADTREGMRMAAERLKELIPEEGTYAVLLGNEAMNSVTQAQEVIEEVMESGKARMIVLSTVERDAETAEEEVCRILEENPNLDGILCNNNALGKGAARGVKKAGKQGQVHVVTIGGSNRLKDYVKEGLIDAVVVRPLDQMMAHVVNQAALLIQNPKQEFLKEQKISCILLNADEIDRLNQYCVE